MFVTLWGGEALIVAVCWNGRVGGCRESEGDSRGQEEEQEGKLSEKIHGLSACCRRIRRTLGRDCGRHN